MNEIYLTILIPAFNEAKRLPATIETIEDYCRRTLKEPHEILVVDDGSMDRTSVILEELKSRNSNLRLHHYTENRGKGHALRIGMQLARGRWILFTDADLSTPIDELQKFLVELEKGAEVVIGTRKAEGANILKHQPLWRESMGKTFTWLSNSLLGLDFSDLTCGFKAFDSVVGKNIFKRQRIDGWAFDSETLFLVKRLGYKTCEIPVRWINSPDTRVRFLQAALSSFKSLIEIRWNWMSGKYAVVDPHEPGRIPADV